MKTNKNLFLIILLITSITSCKKYEQLPELEVSFYYKYISTNPFSGNAINVYASHEWDYEILTEYRPWSLTEWSKLWEHEGKMMFDPTWAEFTKNERNQLCAKIRDTENFNPYGYTIVKLYIKKDPTIIVRYVQFGWDGIN